MIDRWVIFVLLFFLLLISGIVNFAKAAEDFAHFTVCNRSGEPHSTYWVRRSTIGLIQENVKETGRKYAEIVGDIPHKDCVLMHNNAGTHRIFVIGTVESVLKRITGGKQDGQERD